MTVLVVGASGATGRLLVEQLLERGQQVKIIVRSTKDLSERVTSHENLSVIHASVLDLSDTEMARHVSGCDALASCLGHNLSFKGMFGSPRRLVTDATRRLCDAAKANKPKNSVKFVLMNTTGNRNRDLPEPISSAEASSRSLAFTVGTPLEEMEQRMIAATLDHTGGDKRLAAQLLGIAARTIYRKLDAQRQAQPDAE